MFVALVCCPQVLEHITSPEREWHRSILCCCWLQYQLHRQLKQVSAQEQLPRQASYTLTQSAGQTLPTAQCAGVSLALSSAWPSLPTRCVLATVLPWVLQVSEFATLKRVVLKGDLPIGVDKRSVDTWMEVRASEGSNPNPQPLNPLVLHLYVPL